MDEMIKNEHTNLLENGRNRRRSNSGSDGGGGFEIGMHEIESMKLGGPAGDGERISSSSSASGSIKPTLRYKGTNYMSTSAFQTMAEEIVRQRNHMETLAKSRSHDGKTSSLYMYVCMYVCMKHIMYICMCVCYIYRISLTSYEISIYFYHQ